MKLLECVKARAAWYEITEQADPNATYVHGEPLSESDISQRTALIAKVKKDGFDQAMEEAAYTWFNRFCALRFMEVNGYLPSHIRVFTDENNAFKPQILAEAIHLEGLLEDIDIDKVFTLKEANKTNELYKYLLITQCNAFKKTLPGMFAKIEDYSELLFPEHLLNDDSVIAKMVAMIPEKDWKDQVQIIGWLYQYYNTDPKDAVFANLKKNIKISKENIPAATQLFTPDWIVRYMVENSLGRLWAEGHRANDLIKSWKYYLEEAEQEPKVEVQLAEIRKSFAGMKPEDIKCIDPCMGSGHILVYMFDVLVQIYESYGYNTREAAALILKNNLYGLDIDDRAAQLAYFAVMMKAQQYDRRILTRHITPHIYAISDSSQVNQFAVTYFCKEREDLKPAIEMILKEFTDAKEFGSILNITPQDWDALHAHYDELEHKDYLVSLLSLIQIAEVMSSKYDVIVTNPPYMGGSGMNENLSNYVKKHYPDSKSDLFAVFIEANLRLLKPNGYLGMITQHAWMFLSSFENLRKKMQMIDLINMAHLGARAFEEIGGEVVQTTTFVLKNIYTKDYKGTYCRLIEPTTQQGKEDMFLSRENRYTAKQSNFSKIPGSPVAYWVIEKILTCFVKSQSLGKVFKLLAGTSTGDNTLYQRFWHEVSFNNISLYPDNSKRWFPCNTGGSFYKYASNSATVIDWENDGWRIRNHINNKGKIGSAIRNREYYFRSGITWNKLSSSNFGVRFVPEGYISDDTARMIISRSLEQQYYLLAFLCSNVCQNFLAILSPTLSFTNSELERLPYFESNTQGVFSNIINLSKDNHFQSLIDVSSFETSWDFVRHPLLPKRVGDG